MQELMKVATDATEIKISSRLIAKETGKEHRHVARDIRSLIEEIGETKNGLTNKINDLQDYVFEKSYYKDVQGKDRIEYLLTKKEALLLVSGYNPILRAKVIDRLEELEQAQKPKLPTDEIGWIEYALESKRNEKRLKEENQLLSSQKDSLIDILKDQEPLVKMANQVIADDETYTITDVWKLIGSKMKQQDFFQKCRDIGLITKSNHPVADAIRAGLIVKCMGTASTGYEYIQTRVTGKGIKRICEKLKIRTKLIF